MKKQMNMPVLRPIPFEKELGSIGTIMSYTRKWEVFDEYFIYAGDFTVYIPPGFIFDGASIPKLFRNLLSPVGILLIPGLVHDFAYRYHFLYVEEFDGKDDKYSITKDEADLLFLNLANKINGKRVLNRIAYNAVKYFGHHAWNKGGKERSEII